MESESDYSSLTVRLWCKVVKEFTQPEEEE